MRVLVNPEAGGGRVGRIWAKVERGLRRVDEGLEVVYTTGPGSATRLARKAVADGVRDVAVVGGDGIINEAVNGLVADDALRGPDVRLTVLPLGSGSDFARVLDLPQDPEAMPTLLASPAFTAVDVGRAVFRTRAGGRERRYYLNILEAGIGGEVMERVNRSRKRLGPGAAYFGAIVVSLLRYRNPEVAVRVDGDVVASGPMNSVIVANGRYYGRGLLPAPDAKVDDGLLDVILIGDVGRWEAFRNLGALRRGTHLLHPKITALRGETVGAEAEADVLIEMDGEVVGTLPVEVSLLPRLLPVRVLG